MQSEKIFRSTPLTVEDGGVVERLGMRKWMVRMVDGAKGVCWTPALNDRSEPMACPFVKGKNCSYTKVEEEGKETKLRPYSMEEFEKQRIITRIACVNSAAALGASFDNYREYANDIFNFVMEC